MLVASGDRAPLEHSLVGRRLIHRIDLYMGKYGNSNLFYDNKRVHISPLFCTLIFFPRTLVGGGGGGEPCVPIVRIFTTVPCLSILAFFF